jgi:tRNA pseudouridine65 synthase
MPLDRHGNPRLDGPGDCEPPTLLWRDETAAAIAKPSGMLVHNSAFAGRPEWTLMQALPQLLGQNAFGLHRLDRGTSGVVLVSLQREQTSAWQAALQAEEAKKTYLAIVRGRPQQTLDIDYAIADETGVKREARTTLEPWLHSEADRCTLVRLTLHTGRHRQARHHCAHVSHPILGDGEFGAGKLNRYYRETWGLSRLALHAFALDLHHPFTREPLALRCPLPEDLLGVALRLFDPQAVHALR